MKNKFGKLLQSFLTDYIISECNYSNNTKTSYSTTFYLFIQFLETKYKIKSNNIEINKIKREIIVEFLKWLEEYRNVSISTRNQRLACIKSFYKYVQLMEPSLFNTCSQILSIKNKKVPKKIISYFSDEEIKVLINYLNEEKKLKYLTLLCTLYETGARVSELTNIKLEDINLSDNACVTLYGKGNKMRVVPISQELVALINSYIKDIYIDYGENYLFYSRQKRKYNRKSINYIINSIIEKLKIKYPQYFKGNYFPHSFRHTKGTHLYNNGVPLLYIKDFLGHSSITTTEIYAKPDTKKQRKIILNNAQQINVKSKYNELEKDSLDEWLKNNMKL